MKDCSILIRQYFKVVKTKRFTSWSGHQAASLLQLSPGRWQSRRRRCCQSWWLLCGGFCARCDTWCSTGSSWRRAPPHWRCRWSEARGSGPATGGTGRRLYRGSTPCLPRGGPGRRCRTWCRYRPAESRWRVARHPRPACSTAAAGWYLSPWKRREKN